MLKYLKIVLGTAAILEILAIIVYWNEIIGYFFASINGFINMLITFVIVLVVLICLLRSIL